MHRHGPRSRNGRYSVVCTLRKNRLMRAFFTFKLLNTKIS